MLIKENFEFFIAILKIIATVVITLTQMHQRDSRSKMVLLAALDLRESLSKLGYMMPNILRSNAKTDV